MRRWTFWVERKVRKEEEGGRSRISISATLPAQSLARSFFAAVSNLFSVSSGAVTSYLSCKARKGNGDIKKNQSWMTFHGKQNDEADLRPHSLRKPLSVYQSLLPRARLRDLAFQVVYAE
jgi:hypothetical protein